MNHLTPPAYLTFNLVAFFFSLTPQISNFFSNYFIESATQKSNKKDKQWMAYIFIHKKDWRYFVKKNFRVCDMIINKTEKIQVLVNSTFSQWCLIMNI
jgi:hypothetical protein